MQMSQILSDLSSGNFVVSLGGRSVEKLNATIILAATTIAGAILGGALVIGSFIGLAKVDWTLFGLPIVAIFGGVTATAVFFWVSLYLFLRPRMKKISLTRLLMRGRRHLD